MNDLRKLYWEMMDLSQSLLNDLEVISVNDFDLDDEIDDEEVEASDEEECDESDAYMYVYDYDKDAGDEYKVTIEDGVLHVHIYGGYKNTTHSFFATVALPDDANVDETTCKANEYDELVITIPKKVEEKHVEEKKEQPYKKYSRPTSTNFMHQKRDKLGRFVREEK